MWPGEWAATTTSISTVILCTDSAKLVSPRSSTDKKVGGPMKNMRGPIKLLYKSMFKIGKSCQKLIFGLAKHKKFSQCLFVPIVVHHPLREPFRGMVVSGSQQCGDYKFIYSKSDAVHGVDLYLLHVLGAMLCKGYIFQPKQILLTELLSPIAASACITQ